MQIKEADNTYLSFSIENELFAIEVSKVFEVLKNLDITPVPKSTDYIIGIKNFRGNIITVISARKKLNIPLTDKYQEKVIIVFDLEFDNKKVAVGAIADQVHNVINVKPEEIQAVPEFGSYFNPKYLKGVFKHQDNFITILDIHKIFTDQEVQLIQDAQKNNN